MPVRSLSSSVLKWPNAQQVDQAVRAWASQTARQHADICSIGYFGSYARGDWGVGSDLDVIVVLEHSDQPFERRSSEFDLIEVPVPVDLLVYTKDEWKALPGDGRFYQTMRREAVWIYGDNCRQDRG